MTDYNVNPNNYSDSNFWNKVSKCASKMGSKLVYNVLILYYVMKSPGVPFHIKTAIVAAVGMVADMITPDIKRKAADKVRDIFGTTDGCDLAA